MPDIPDVQVRYSSRAARFRALLTAPELSFVMEAHSGLSAKIAEEAGFPAIWASGLSIATALGVRDRNEASWTQILEVLEFMADATTVPILLDGDTGYGDFNNFRRLVRKLCQRGIAAVCIEDKIFPKTNSFVDGPQMLADVNEFCGKIKAGKDSQTDPAFSIVARVEALIAGWGMDEALRRAEAYQAAGADAILIHSRRSSAEEVLGFAREWAGRLPLVIVPTKYYATPTQAFRDAGISMVIWANHNLRASIQAMRETSRRIFQDQSLLGVEDRVAPLSDVFALVGTEEIAEAERRYLPGRPHAAKAILLAASRGQQLGALTLDRPKCMLGIGGEPLLQRLVRSFTSHGLRDITVVAGYRPDTIDLANIRKRINAAYETTGELASLACALDQLDGECVICYGDILFRDYILGLLLGSEAEIAVVVDAARNEPAPRRPPHTADLAQCSAPFTGSYLEDGRVELLRIASELPREAVQGEWIGLVKLNPAGSARVRQEIRAIERDGLLDRASVPDLLNRLIANGARPHVIYVAGHWLDVNDAFDLAKAHQFR